MEKKSSIFHRTAILVFANSAKEESNNKSIVHSEELFADLNRQTKQTVEKAGLPVIHLGENEQKGSTFGERFVNAIQYVFDKGFEYVISVGNDTPKLKSQHLLLALRELEEGIPVLGPSTDGGFYLMGIRNRDFSAEEFLQLPWQSPHILHAVLGLLGAKGHQVCLLERLMDIDNEDDIRLFIRRNNNISLSILFYFRAYLQRSNSFFDHEKQIESSYYTSSLYNKGSPARSFNLS